MARYNNSPYEIEWNNHILEPEQEKKIYLRVIKFDGYTVTSKTYEELKEKSILTRFMEQSKDYEELLRNFIIVGFSFKTNVIYNILKNGIKMSDSRQIYRYVGHSNSQLREDFEKTCFLMPADTNVKVFDFLDSFSSDFAKIQTIEKQAKRIAQLFSRFTKSVKLNTNEYKLINDVQNKNYIFTDGCGFMSTEFAEQVKSIYRLNYVPSVCQIRYRGFKGVLLHVPEITSKKVYFRESMKKFDTQKPEFDFFGVVDVSRSFRPAYLNTQIIMLLESIGVSKRMIKLKQDDFFDILKDLSSNMDKACKYLSCFGNADYVDSIHNHKGIDKTIETYLTTSKKKEIEKMFEFRQRDKPKYKTRILIPKSRLVFGACDPYALLDENECYFNPSVLRQDEFEDVDIVLVTRNPCYAPGDIRKLKLANKKYKKQYSHLNDCILFSVKGERSMADQMSGGDLDGDQFMVIWDFDLIPRETANPFVYKDPTSSKTYVDLKPSLSNDNIVESSFDRKPNRQSKNDHDLPPKNSSSILTSKLVNIKFPINFECCDEKFDDSMKNLETLLKSHFIHFHPNESFVYKCSKCTFENEKYKSISTHYRSHGTSEPTVSTVKKEAPKTHPVSTSGLVSYPIDFKCCDIIFNDKTKSKEKVIQDHFTNQHGKAVIFFCSACNTQFDSLKGVSIHFPKCKGNNGIEDSHKVSSSLTRHASEDPFQINGFSSLSSHDSVSSNGSKTDKKDDLELQVLADSKSLIIIDFPINFKCLCAETFKAGKNIEKKIIEHFCENHPKKEIVYRCRKCKESFPGFLVASSHYGSCNNQEPNHVEKTLKQSKENAKTKEKIVESQTLIFIPFPIDFTCVCGEKFGKNRKQREKAVIEHMGNEIHKNEKYSFQCSKCDSTFDEYENVHKHFEKCKDQKEILKNKLNVFSIPYPIDFTCDCGEVFGRNRKNKKDTVIKHFEDMHPTITVNFICKQCSDKFAIYEECDKHYNSVHSVEKKIVHKSDSLLINDASMISNEKKNEIRDNLIKYFSEFDSTMVGSLDSLFMRFAAIKGPECEECATLNKYLSSALDMRIKDVPGLEELKKKIVQIEKENMEGYIQKNKAWTDIKDATEKFVNKYK